jgi:hypothetical protein
MQSDEFESNGVDFTPLCTFVSDETEEDKKASAAYSIIAQKNAFSHISEKNPMYGPALLSKGGVDIVSKLLENLHRNNGVPEGKEGFKRMTQFPDDIPVFTADHESRLLCECHKFALPNGTLASMKACAGGKNCVGLNANIAGHEKSGGGVIIRALLTPEELTVFETTGKSPIEDRLCVLCARWYMATAFFWCQENRNEKYLQNMIINWYVNPRDCEGGYKGDHMIPLGAYPGWRAMIGPVVCNSLHNLRLVRRGHVWWVDQSKLLWQGNREDDEPQDVKKARLFH